VARLAPAGTAGPAGLTLVGCFHPSRQNTHTGKVTAVMYDELFRRAIDLALDLAARS
jgi:uracil-DNA glycosylase